MFNRKSVMAFVVVAAGSLAALTGCDWLSGSDPGSRQSPSVNSLIVKPAAVFCAADFTVSFRFDDPQGDITRARITYLLQGQTVGREESLAWPAATSTSSGTVTFTSRFACPGDPGVYSVSVLAEDVGGRQSNVLVGEIRLN